MKKLFILFLFLLFPLQLFSYTRDIEEFMHYIQENFIYVSDNSLFNYPEYWQTPEEFEKNKAGDCEDFALYIRDKLRDAGYIVDTYAILMAEGGHAINYVWDYENNKVYITSNSDLIKVEIEPLPSRMGIFERLCKDYHLKEILLVVNDVIYGKQNECTQYNNLVLIKEYPNEISNNPTNSRLD